MVLACTKWVHFDSEQVPEVGKDYYCTNIKLRIKVTIKKKIKIYKFHGSD